MTFPRPSLPSMLVTATARFGVHCRMSPGGPVDISERAELDLESAVRVGVVWVIRGGERREGDGEMAEAVDGLELVLQLAMLVLPLLVLPQAIGGAGAIVCDRPSARQSDSR